MFITTLQEFFESGYFHFAITTIAFILVFLMFIVTLIKSKKVSVIQIIILTIIFCLAVFRPVCSYFFNYEPAIYIFDQLINFDLYSSALTYLLLILSHVIYYLDTKDTFKNKLLYRLAPENLGKKIYAYYDKKGNVISYTEMFFDELSIPLNNNQKWYKEVSSFEVNGIEMDYEKYKEFIKESGDITLKLTLLVDDEYISFVMEKWTIENNCKTIGFILTSKQEEQVLKNDGFLNVLDCLTLPIAYFNEESKNICYKINKPFAMLLGIKGSMISKDELEKYVYCDDLNIYKTNTISSSQVKYRVQTNQGIKVFEEVKIVNENNVTSIITVNTEKKEIIYEKIDFVKVVNSLISSSKDYGVILISLNSINNLYDELGNDITKELIKKYLEIISKQLLKEEILCRISDMEYCILFTDLEKFSNVVLDITKDNSILLTYDVVYDSKHYKLLNKLGIVYSSEQFANSNDVFKALDEAVSFVNKKGYEKRYSITQSSNKQKEIKEYRFEDYKVNIDNGFLSED